MSATRKLEHSFCLQRIRKLFEGLNHWASKGVNLQRTKSSKYFAQRFVKTRFMDFPEKLFLEFELAFKSQVWNSAWEDEHRTFQEKTMVE